MKKFITLILITLTLSVNAEITTYERTEKDLRINDWVTVTEANKDNILNTPSVDETAKVYDFADLLTDTEEQNLYTEINEYINTYNMDLAIVTINDNYSNAQTYADDFYDYNNFGIGDNYSGSLVLIDMDTREFYISTTGDAILMYNDYRINRVLDDMTDDMINGYYYDALTTSVEDLSNYASMGIPEGNSNSYIDSNGDYVYVKNEEESPLGLFLFISLIVATIVLVIFINKNKLVKKAYEASAYLEEDHKNIKNLGDHFLTTHTSKVRIESDSGSSSSRSGGSSSHRSSSGRSHGGGGRRF